jgi:outer membrane protein, heavy metal efflux system
VDIGPIDSRSKVSPSIEISGIFGYKNTIKRLTILSTFKLLVSLAVFVILAGCTIYSRKPLSEAPSLFRDLSHILIDARNMPLPELASHRFDPKDGLDMTETAMLAVVNNPELKLARDDCGIAHAQAFSAGLLPDPQLNYAVDFPTGNIPGSNYTAFTYGLSYDVLSLVTRSAVTKGAAADNRKIDLNLLWLEWQVVARARLFFIRTFEQDRLSKILEENRNLIAKRYDHAVKALNAGNLTLDAVSVDLAALQDANRQISELTRKISQNRANLNQLLGVAPDVILNLVGESSFPTLDDQKIKALLPGLVKRRPDILALKAGYDSQEQKYRKAVLEQFPALNIGITSARDTSNVNTIGFGITMNLPIFNRNRGNVAIEQATRKRLYDEFEMRLNRAYAEISQLLAEQHLTEKQLVEARQGMSIMTETAANAGAAFADGNIDETSYLNLRLALANKRIEEIGLEQLLLEQRVALQTLIGGELPVKLNSGGEQP